jgi:hypothetical protein
MANVIQEIPCTTHTCDRRTRFVPLPAFIYKDAYTFYLPIYFKDGIRIEVEALGENEEMITGVGPVYLLHCVAGGTKIEACDSHPTASSSSAPVT